MIAWIIWLAALATVWCGGYATFGAESCIPSLALTLAAAPLLDLYVSRKRARL